jgi:hypothetical protein
LFVPSDTLSESISIGFHREDTTKKGSILMIGDMVCGDSTKVAENFNKGVILASSKMKHDEFTQKRILCKKQQ